VSTSEDKSFHNRKVLRSVAGSSPASETDQLAVEEPLEIRVDTRPVSVTMRTPGHDQELALGFLFSEGLIHSASDVLKVAARPDEVANGIDVFLNVTLDFARLTRHVFASSSCGICGKATIEAVHQHFSAVQSQMHIAAETLLALPGKLRQAQETFNRTGGLHAAALFDEAGKLLLVREDIDRIMSADKILGHGLLHNSLPFEKHILLVSGRASFEIIQKALSGQLPIVAAVSAPSSLAVEFAEASNQTLVGFLRGERMNIYAGHQRIKFSGS